MPSSARASALALAATLLALSGCGGSGGGARLSDKDRAVAEAKAVYQQFKASGASLASGPCIAEQLTGLPDWVADTAHNPRQHVDDLAINQCQRYRSGQAHHFVELDLSGQLIRAQ